MANPFLVLGGIAVGIVTAAFGVLQVPGWVATAQDAAAINDMANIRIAQAAHAAETGSYASDLSQLSITATPGTLPVSGPVAGGADEFFFAAGNDFGVQVTLSDGVELVGMVGTDQDWCSVVQSASGKYVAGSNAEAEHGDDVDVEASLNKTGCTPEITDQIVAIAIENGHGPAAPEEPAGPDAAFTLNCPTSGPATVSVGMPLLNAHGTLTWSDGETVQVDGTAPAKTLTAGQTYTVEFDGTFETLQSALYVGPANIQFPLGVPALQCFTSMDAWSEAAGTTSAAGAFAATRISSLPEEIPSTVTDTSWMFYGTTYNGPEVSGWDMSNVTNMSSMFYSSTFNQPLAAWDTSNVTNMSGMFSSNTVFNQPIGDWNTGSVTNMGSMFAGTLSSTSAFNQPIENWDVSNVTDMSNMFWRSNYNQPLEEWDVSSVKTMATMFYQSKFNQPIAGWDVSNVTDMYQMFLKNSVFNQPLDSWKTTSLTRTQQMFKEATAFNQPLASWDTSKVTTMKDMFWGNYAFVQDLSGWNVSSVPLTGRFSSSFTSLTTALMPRWV